MVFFSLKKSISLSIFTVNLNYYTTQSGGSRDSNLGREPLFADPCIRLRKRLYWLITVNETIMRILKLKAVVGRPGKRCATLGLRAKGGPGVEYVVHGKVQISKGYRQSCGW